MDARTSSPLDAPPALTHAQKVFTMVGALLGMLLAALDQTIVSTAGPAMQADLDIPASLYAWITTSYLVASTVLVPVYGKLSDGFGRRRILVIGIGIFLGGSVLCGLSQTTLQLILARAVQGAGSAALFISAFAVVADIFPPSERGKYQGLFGATFGLSSVVGPLVGGFLTDNFSWHWVFYVNLPVGAVALFFILTRMPPLRRPGVRVKVDVLGALALAVFTVPLLLAMSLGRGGHAAADAGGYPWGSPQILGMFALAAAGLAAFVLVERRAEQPILDLGLFRNRVFAVGNVAAFVNGAVFLGAIVFLPLFMVNVVGMSATRSGLTIMPLTMGIVAGNVLSGQLVSRLGRYKPLLLVAGVVLIAAFAVMGFTLSPSSTQGELTLKMVLIGLGLGPAIPILTLAIQNAVRPEQVGVATSAATFFRQMGSTIGVALMGTVFGASLTTALETRMAEATRDVPAELRAQFQQGMGGAEGAAAAEEGAPAQRTFDEAQVKARIARQFEARRAQLASSGGRDDPAALAGLDAAQARANATVERVGLALKQGFTEAISDIYRITLLISLLALLVTALLPELPLRKHQGGGPPAALE
jgi:EmrB/QacA subfamily drug resistance transporter